ncbi:cytochrome c oxidase subunit II [Terriglobus albidus]|uniref:cytochrome c oxidase subunit II n=1 Tax=Terriglobus albidus TaxID=1592106 RepID=UPI0021E0D92E|nr:cytochrome c oxidase subunit II [Terriglobus albidus]
MLWNVARSCCLSCAALLVWPHWPGNIFSTSSTPAREVHGLSLFILVITGGIFIGVASLLVFALVRFRHRAGDMTEPPQVFGSTQIELAWTIIPILLIIVLFLGTARVIFAVQDAPKPASALDVTVIGHQFWWEFRYPKYNVVTANELHVPLSDPQAPTPTFLKLTSADVMHSFWIPRLAGKTDVLPNRVNEMWVDPHEPGLFLGQCAQFCGTQHAKMLLRVYVDSPQDFQRWIAQQQRAQQSGTPDPAPSPQGPNLGNDNPAAGVPPNTPPTRGEIAAQLKESSDAITPEQGRRVFEEQACMNCHTISGTAANGRFGPDLTHLMSRATIASGIVPNTPENLRIWITTPDELKPGSLMPAMHLNDLQNAQLVAYLTTLR